MSVITIPANIYGEYSLFPGVNNIQVGLLQSMKDNLEIEGREEVTKEVAIQALKSVEMYSKIKAFMSKPIVIILTGAFFLSAALALNIAVNLLFPVLPLLVILKVMALCLTVLGLGTIGYGIRQIFNKTWSNVYQFYQSQALDAHAWIERLEKSKNIKIILP